MADTDFLSEALEALSEFSQNVIDISGEAGTVFTTILSTATAAIALGEAAYPYVVKAIDGAADMFEQLGEQYTVVAEKLREVKLNLEAQAVRLGYDYLGYDDDYFEKVRELAAKQVEVEGKTIEVED